MPLYTYNRDTPDTPDDPSVSQPDMFQNTNSIDDLIDEDHYSFNDNNGGLHKQARLVAGSLPSGRASGLGTIYTKTVTRAAVNTTEQFYVADNSLNEYQMTQTIPASYAGTFAQQAAYGSPPAGFSQVGGWTFLPGGLIYQWGFYSNPGNLGSGGTIPFPVAFTAGPYTLQLTLYRDSGRPVCIDSDTPPSTTSFTFVADSSGADGLYWQAIGK